MPLQTFVKPTTGVADCFARGQVAATPPTNPMIMRRLKSRMEPPLLPAAGPQRAKRHS
jgi:hypothetical protein